MQAIETRYVPAGNVRGSRVSAICAARRISLPWENDISPDQNHKNAATELCRRMGWTGRLARGTMRDGTTVWVFYDKLHPVDEIIL